MLINKLLSSAVKLWLKSQVSEVKSLKTTIIGTNKQILKGYIPKVIVYANNAVYQQISLSKIEITGTNIKFDLSKIASKKSFELLEPIVINVNVLLTEENLKKSLSSSLLNSGLTDVWYNFLDFETQNIKKEYQIYSWYSLELFENGIDLKGIYQQSEKNNSLIGIKTKIISSDKHFLLFSPISIDTIPELAVNKTQPLTFDLGKQVSIDELKITQKQLSVRGTITIYPEIS